MVDLPAKVEDRSNEYHHVVGKEGLDHPLAGQEDAVAVGAHDRGHEDETDPRGVWLEPAAVGESLAVQTLCTAGPVEEDVGDAYHDVINDLRGRDEIDEPAEHFSTRVGQVEKGQTWEDHDGGKAVYGHSILGALAQELGCVSLEGKSIETTTAAVSV